MSSRNNLEALYSKTWTAEQVGYPPNGGGGSLCYATDLSCSNLTAHDLRRSLFSISQCTSFSGAAGDFTLFKFEIGNVTVNGISGTTERNTVAIFQCSGVKYCSNIALDGVDLVLASNGTKAVDYVCGNMIGATGFKCT